MTQDTQNDEVLPDQELNEQDTAEAENKTSESTESTDKEDVGQLHYVPDYGVTVKAVSSEDAVNKAKAMKGDK